jgi:tRNA1(Val) A37 N6-methylase TrmN6
VPHGEFTFLDFGSGKGRTLMLAAQFPFKRIVGVEYCDELSRLARQNLLRLPAGERRCENVEVVTVDAAEYAIPEDPLVIFMYNPFSEPVMASVVRNVTDSLQKKPRRVVVIYYFPFFGSLWEAAGFVKRAEQNLAFFETQPPAIDIQRETATQAP